MSLTEQLDRPSAAATAPPTPSDPGADVSFRVARDLKEVIASWRVVYDVYLRSGFIHPNPYLIHTTPHMVSQCSAVFHSAVGDDVESTLTAVADGPLGLPLDSVYQAELDAFRRRGRRLTEYGLFAHVRQLASPEGAGRRDGAAESADGGRRADARVQSSIVNLMRLAFYFALSRNSTDFVVGVHPRHVRFYSRAFGFRTAGTPRTYATVNHRPVVLLHASLEESLAMKTIPHALEYCLQNPVDMGAFSQRFSFDARAIAAAPIRIDAYLREKHRHRRAG